MEQHSGGSRAKGSKGKDQDMGTRPQNFGQRSRMPGEFEGEDDCDALDGFEADALQEDSADSGAGHCDAASRETDAVTPSVAIDSLSLRVQNLERGQHRLLSDLLTCVAEMKRLQEMPTHWQPPPPPPPLPLEMSTRELQPSYALTNLAHGPPFLPSISPPITSDSDGSPRASAFQPADGVGFLFRGQPAAAAAGSPGTPPGSPPPTPVAPPDDGGAAHTGAAGAGTAGRRISESPRALLQASPPHSPRAPRTAPGPGAASAVGPSPAVTAAAAAAASDSAAESSDSFDPAPIRDGGRGDGGRESAGEEGRAAPGGASALGLPDGSGPEPDDRARGAPSPPAGRLGLGRLSGRPRPVSVSFGKDTGPSPSGGASPAGAGREAGGRCLGRAAGGGWRAAAAAAAAAGLRLVFGIRPAAPRRGIDGSVIVHPHSPFHAGSHEREGERE